MTSETDEFERFMFCIAFCSWGSIQNALQNILGNSHGGSFAIICPKKGELFVCFINGGLRLCLILDSPIDLFWPCRFVSLNSAKLATTFSGRECGFLT